MSRVALAQGADRVGLAVMLADLIRQSLEQKPEKLADFDRLRTTVLIQIPDADVAATLVFDRGSLTVHGGAWSLPEIRICAGAESLLALCMVRIVRGLPDPVDRHNRALLKDILRRTIRIAGLARRPIQLIRFTRLMSVREG